MRKKVSLILFVMLAIIAVAAISIKIQFNQYLSQSIYTEQPVLFTVQPRTSFRSLLSQLSEQRVISLSWTSKLICHVYPTLCQIKAGTYLITDQLTLHTLLQMIHNGKEHQFSITFIEGSQFREWQALLAEQSFLQHKTSDMTEAQIAKAIGSSHDKLEGLLLPETYYYTAGMSDLTILKRAYQDLNHTLQKEWQARQKNIPLQTAYEALTLASIIEKETAYAPERQKVASVFINRLRKGMRLQTDPTVIYGMGERYHGNIRKRDLLSYTPYNTYIIKGLPPTPIAMPSAAAVHAALNPEHTKYIYFVAQAEGKGHVFSQTLSQHKKAVDKYINMLRKRHEK